MKPPRRPGGAARGQRPASRWDQDLSKAGRAAGTAAAFNPAMIRAAPDRAKLLVQIAAFVAAGWTVIGPAGLVMAVADRTNLDRGWFGLGLLVFQAPCALLTATIVLPLAVAARSEWAKRACVVTFASDAILCAILCTLPPGSGC